MINIANFIIPGILMISPILTASPDVNSSPAPQKEKIYGDSLYQNYPNPWVNSTTIPYEISDTVNVTLKVLDIFGRPLKTLVDEEQVPGKYEVRFDGKNEDGEQIQNTLLTYRLRLNNVPVDFEVMHKAGR